MLCFGFIQPLVCRASAPMRTYFVQRTSSAPSDTQTMALFIASSRSINHGRQSRPNDAEKAIAAHVSKLDHATGPTTLLLK